MPIPPPTLAFSCPLDWEAMAGDARVRHCERCERTVHDLGELTDAEVAALLAPRDGGSPCVRMEVTEGAIVTRTTVERRLLALLRRRAEG